jgi:hypothetical protein
VFKCPRLLTPPTLARFYGLDGCRLQWWLWVWLWIRKGFGWCVCCVVFGVWISIGQERFLYQDAFLKLFCLPIGLKQGLGAMGNEVVLDALLQASNEDANEIRLCEV